jgi:ubiquinone/menaquinone biosynthesis C-methylase UbiE
VTRERFDKVASSWDTEPLRLDLATAVSEAIRTSIQLTKRMTALEIGCGTGLLTTSLAESLARIDAADSSEGMLSVLKEKINLMGIDNIRPFRCDFVENVTLPFSSEYHIAYCSMTMHHMRDIDLFLAKCYSLLQPDGILAIADLEREDGSFHGNMPGIEHFGFEPENLAQKFTENGFINTAVKTIHIISKKDLQGIFRTYPVFLLTAAKSHLPNP